MTINTLRKWSETRVATSAADIDLRNDAIQTTPHVFITVKFLLSDVVTTPSAGTYTIEVRAIGMDNFEAITNGTAIDATAASATLSYAANAEELRYTPTGITGVDAVQITIAGNYS